MRPNEKDTAALADLLDDETVPERDAEFLDSLTTWQGDWTPKQAGRFDGICARQVYERSQRW